MIKWSTLQRHLYGLIDSKLNFQIHCNVGSIRYWITLDGDVIWDYPGEFVHDGETASDGSEIWGLISEYINVPGDAIQQWTSENDQWGLGDILKAADKRLPLSIIANLLAHVENDPAERVAKERLRHAFEQKKVKS